MNNLLINALNKTLSLDPESFDRLKTLDNKIVILTILPIDVSLRFKITAAGFETSEQHQADISISGKPSDFIKLSQQHTKNLYNSGIKIIGDMGLADEIKTILSQLDLDWEAFIASYTGDIPARQIMRATKAGLHFIKNAQQNLQQNMLEFFQEEIQILPTRVEMQDFTNDNTAFRDAVARLEAKLSA